MADTPILSVSELRVRLGQGRFRLSDHALTRMVEKNISLEMIKQSAANAELIEDYPQDKYSPSCLLLGYSEDGTPLHMQVSRLENPEVKLITLYVPDAAKWINFRQRRTQA